MLVVISDLHLNDGTVCTASDQGASKVFLEDLKTLASKASFRADGSVQHVQELDIVLNGDIFDLVRSDIWNERGIRPWDDVETFAPLVAEIAQRIADQNDEFCSVFRNLSEKGLEYWVLGQQRKAFVTIHYLVGNHDWFMHHPSPLFEPTREIIRKSLGLKQLDFPWELEETGSGAASMRKACLTHKVYARHGDKFDEINYHEKFGRNYSSLGDAVVIELVNSIPIVVEKKIKEKYPNEPLPKQLLAALEELDNIRPSTHSLLFLRNIITHIAASKHKKIIEDALDECTKNIIKSKIYKEIFSSKHWFVAVKTAALQLSAKIVPTYFVELVLNLLKLGSSRYIDHAANEAYIKNGLCKFVVYGHTHIFELEGIGTKRKGNLLTNTVYINSATWRPIHHKIAKETKEFPYITKKTMTWVVFYKDGERSGREYETWTGNIGVR